MNMHFYIPTRLITGRDCIRQNAALLADCGTRALLITGRSAARRSGALADVTAALEAGGIPWALYDRIPQNPTLAGCQAAAALGVEFRADLVIGIGGGSALDAAKAVAVLVANPGMTQAELYSLHWPISPLPIVCVGTTAGTGSEVTAVAVLTRPDGTKKSITADSLFPTLSITDPGYTASMSDYFTRSTAVDALAHCIESYFSRRANAISKAWALEGVRVLLPELKILAEYGSAGLNHHNRAALYHGSICGGFAISVTGTAFPHTIGYPLTEQFGLPHGVACAVFLPDFLRYNATVMPELAAAFFRGCGSTLDDLLHTVQQVTPAHALAMTTGQICALEPRWHNNRSIQNTWGQLEAAVISELYRKHFCK